MCCLYYHATSSLTHVEKGFKCRAMARFLIAPVSAASIKEPYDSTGIEAPGDGSDDHALVNERRHSECFPSTWPTIWTSGSFGGRSNQVAANKQLDPGAGPEERKSWVQDPGTPRWRKEKQPTSIILMRGPQFPLT